MDIDASGNSITIKGNIKSVSDYQMIKSAVDAASQASNSVTIVIEDSISIISSVIGYFNKLVRKDSVDLQIRVGNEQLMELFRDLGLVALFKVKKI